MALTPAFDTFAEAYDDGRNQVVFTRLAADLDTPVSLMLKLAGQRANSFLLESVTGGEVRGRYSIIGLKPDLIWQCRGRTSRVNRQARFDDAAWEDLPGDPLDGLRALIAESRIDLPDGLPAAAAGLFGYLGYDMVRLVERLPEPNPDPLGMPDAVMLRPSIVAVLDGVKGEVTVVSPAWTDSGLSARAAYAQAAERVMDAVRDLERATPSDSRDLGDAATPPEPVSNFTHDDYLDAVRKAKEYIAAGDIFQVVPSQRWRQPFELPPFALYRSLRRTNPSPFMFHFDFGDAQVIGASPEILVRVFGGEVTIRPIAGTRPRGATPEEDRALEVELLGDEKERAEHLMLLDLGRNDVGRVAQIGTVRPTERFVIERYSHVMHIVSNVVGELAPEHDALSALLAGLPAGTVSGAPKVRAMEIIDELEPEKRGVYGGGVGYFSSGGDMDMCIALRTAVVKDRQLYIQAGGGVVHDSDPEAEWQETVNKSRAIRKAAAEAGLFTRSGN
ncbi:anthranilate synthase component I [Roseitranquillus sediminis]|uniref:anthranilate synthase component I n=1 Tax=Roseitranquillus sediminis TaxID=2809051 RepID=UPI001D0CC61F|nr:anthranilate synthase component I [Roseitranquillus sediminis]MBM9594431.1 anthranilate synthase component I [Roseitranquillus sediminis]